MSVRVDTPDDDSGRAVAPAVVYALRRQGSRVFLPDTYVPYFGARYYLDSTARPNAVVDVGPPDAPVPDGGRLVGRFPPVTRIAVTP
jgi:hypothetical protein